MLVALLTGCRLDVDVATTVGPDGSGTVAVTLVADAELAGATPGLLADLRLDDLRRAGWTATGPTEAADGGASLTLTKPFGSPAQATAVLAEVGGPLRALAVAQQSEFARLTTTFTGTVEAVGLDGYADVALVQALGSVPLADRVTPEQLASGLGLTVHATLPGEITGTNGAVTDATVSWQPPLQPGAVSELQAAAALVDEDALAAEDRRSWATSAFWGWLGLVALATLVTMGVLFVRRRHRRHRVDA